MSETVGVWGDWGRGETTMVGDESGKIFVFFKHKTRTIGSISHTYSVNQRRKWIQKHSVIYTVLYKEKKFVSRVSVGNLVYFSRSRTLHRAMYWGSF